MIFNSVEFPIFFGIVVLAHFACPHRYRWVVLLLASYTFYMWWEVSYALLIMLSTVVDFMAGRVIFESQRARVRTAALLASLSVNLGMLFSFKYWNFFQESVSTAAAWVGLSYTPAPFDVLLPVGISFYTFQTLSYTIDVYRGAMQPEKHLGRFALYVAFFPQLVAGPIERASRLLPQISAKHDFEWTRVNSGLQLMLWGLFKKIVIADRLAIYVDAVYSNVPEHNGATLLVATYAFAFQIYCDFSGYSDIAIGAAWVLGFRLMENFRQPYWSRDIVEFWRRWHISLSTWLRDYLYIPLGGNRRGIGRTHINLMVTMLLGGLWHGASWTFVIWGGLQGVLLIVARHMTPRTDRIYEGLRVPTWLRDGVRVLLTFHLVCLSWIFFRAVNVSDALSIMLGVFSDPGMPLLDVPTLGHAAVGLVVLAAVEVIQVTKGSVRLVVAGLPTPIRWAVWYTLLFSVLLFGVDGGSQFIYFQF
jgi:alginate O-acetyltransferase complex protein AlgI